MPTSNESFITIALTKVRSHPEPVPSAPPMKSIWSAICWALFVVVPWSSSDAARSPRRPFPAGPGRPGAHQQPHAHGGLLVVQHGDRPACRSASVRISYGGNFTSRAAQRPRRPFGRPARNLRAGRARAQHATPNAQLPAPTMRATTPTRRIWRSGLGIIIALSLRQDVQDHAVGLVEVGLRDALDVGRRHRS